MAIITGRAVDDIRKRLGFEPRLRDRQPRSGRHAGWETRSKDYRGCLRGLARRRWSSRCAYQQRFDPGMRLEDKGYSLSVHYRQARDPALAEQRLLAVFETLEPSPRVVRGQVRR